MEKLTSLLLNRIKGNPTRTLCGGKALPFFELQKINIPFPKGFVVLSNAYGLFLKNNGLEREIKKICTKNSISAAELGYIRNKIQKGKIPASIDTAIKKEIAHCRRPAYAVRSSANLEDSRNKSWAGQFDTVLGVKDKDIERAIKQCYASIFTPRVLSYVPTPSHLLKIHMAVLIQEMINSDVSGVCFTHNPINAKDKDLRIEAVSGLGELLVQGTTSPDRYLVERKPLIIAEVITCKQKYKLSMAGKNIKKISLSKGCQSRQKLSGREIIKLAKLALILERHQRSGIDIEWCKKGNKFYVLQSRPIINSI